MPTTEPERRHLDVAHVVKLANLPLDDDECGALTAELATVLEAFSLHDVQAAEERSPACPTFDDAVDPWPAEGVEAIVAAFPKREGRRIRT